MTQSTRDIVAQPIELGRLVPNPWNPNRMSDEEFAELVAEVKHLGRIAKPIIARPAGDKFEIVDGEHNYRAAKKVGFLTVPVEVDDLDDFEAMRQTLKRNQSGTHNKVLEGRLFLSMMADRGMNNTQMAEEIGVSEGTIRNAVAYAELADRIDADVSHLPVRTIRELAMLPARIARAIVEYHRGDISKAFPSDTRPRITKAVRGRTILINSLVERWGDVLDSDLVDVWDFEAALERDAGLAMADLVQIARCERRLKAADVTELRRHFRPFYGVAPHKHEMHRIAECFIHVYDAEQDTYRLTPERIELEWEASHGWDIDDRIKVALIDCGYGDIVAAPDSEVTRKLEMLKLEQEAPDYLKESKHADAIRLGLFSCLESRTAGKWTEQAVRELAAADEFPPDPDPDEPGTIDDDSVGRVVRQRMAEYRQAELAREAAERIEKLNNTSADELATAIAAWAIGDDDDSADRRRSMATRLSELDHADLVAMFERATAGVTAEAQMEQRRATALELHEQAINAAMRSL